MRLNADMAELADALDLESCGKQCRFKSYYPHQVENDEFCNKTAKAVLFALTSISIFSKKFFDTFWEP